MNDEKLTQTPEASAMPQLPDGIGMTLEQVVALLAEKHKTIVSQDDPILMVVTLLNSFLAQENALMDRHKQALAMVMADKTDGFVQSVQKAVAQTGETFASATVESMKQTIQKHHVAMDDHQKNIFWLSVIAAISAMVNIGVFAWLFIN